MTSKKEQVAASVESNDGMILGRYYISKPPIMTKSAHKNHRLANFYKKPQGRILVQGLHKADGTHIRFKSLQRAENHIRNMKFILEV